MLLLEALHLYDLRGKKRISVTILQKLKMNIHFANKN